MCALDGLYGETALICRQVTLVKEYLWVYNLHVVGCGTQGVQTDMDQQMITLTTFTDSCRYT